MNVPLVAVEPRDSATRTVFDGAGLQKSGLVRSAWCRQEKRAVDNGVARTKRSW